MLLPLAAVVCIASVLLIQWRWDQALGAQRAALVLSRIDAAANYLSSLEWRAVSSDGVGSDVRGQLQQTHDRLRLDVARLVRGKPASATAEHTLAALVSEYQRAIEQELALLVAGKRDVAESVDAQRVDPAFAELHKLLNAERAAKERAAQTSADRALTGVVANVVVMLLLVALLLWQRSRRLAARARSAGVRDSERRFRALAQDASDLIVVLGADGVIQYTSDSVSRTLGYDHDELIGSEIEIVLAAGDLTRVAALLDRSAHGTPAQERFECRLRHRDGHLLQMETVAAALTGEPWPEGSIVLTSRSIEERKSLERQLRHQAFHDDLTSLPNRALFEDRVEIALLRARRTHAHVAVMFIDLDDFKLVNDSLGHAVGDELLREVAARLRSAMRASDTPARLGGDEFAVLIESPDTPADVMALAARLLRTLEEPCTVGDQELSPHASLGVAISDEQTSTAEDLLRDADIAMYTVKAAHKAGCALFEPAMRVGPARRFKLTRELGRALEADEFELYYQPIVKLETAQVIGMEALLRWDHPTEGTLGPGAFLEIAEQTGLIVPLGKWVVEEACRELARWHRERLCGESLYMSVNVSAVQLRDPHLVGDVAAAIRNAGIAPGQLVLELTESLLIENIEETSARLHELKRLGVRLAVDDFGTGQSALGYLQQFPLDIIKIDKSFIDDLTHRHEQSRIVSAILTLGGNLDIDVIVEGIEEAEQARQLRTLDSRYGQGYFFARPCGAHDTEMMLAQSADRGGQLSVEPYDPPRSGDRRAA